MRVYIVLKNSKVDEVFDNPEAAELHRKNAAKGWNLTKIIEREVNSI